MEKKMPKAVGFRILVRPDPIEEVSKGGIVLALDERLERGAQVTGVVLDVGPEAYRAFNKAAYGLLYWLFPMFFYRPWIKVGDHIYYARYAGKRVLTPDTKEELLYLNDEDVAGLV
jgi:co-chaperonin GroES (HSP10)